MEITNIVLFFLRLIACIGCHLVPWRGCCLEVALVRSRVSVSGSLLVILEDGGVLGGVESKAWKLLISTRKGFVF